MPPPEMVANLKADNVDGYLAPDPFNQRAVYENAGFIFMLSKEIWPGHPCCAFAISQEFAKTYPNTFLALFKSIVETTHYALNRKTERRWRKRSRREYHNQTEIVLEQLLQESSPDGSADKNSPRPE